VTTDRVLPTGILGAEAGHLGRRRPAHVFAGLYQPVLALSVALSLLALLVAVVGRVVDSALEVRHAVGAFGRALVDVAGQNDASTRGRA